MTAPGVFVSDIAIMRECRDKLYSSHITRLSKKPSFYHLFILFLLFLLLHILFTSFWLQLPIYKVAFQTSIWLQIISVNQLWELCIFASFWFMNGLPTKTQWDARRILLDREDSSKKFSFVLKKSCENRCFLPLSSKHCHFRIWCMKVLKATCHQPEKWSQYEG